MKNFLLLLFTVFIASTLCAQENPEEGWRWTVGAGSIYAPAFQGSKTNQLMVVPIIEAAYKDRFFASFREGIGYRFTLPSGVRVGPVLRYEFAREEDADSPFTIAGGRSNALQGLGEVDATWEPGIFVEYSYQQWLFHAQLRQGIGGHEGAIAEFNARYSGDFNALERRIFYSVGPGVKFASAKYHEAYFGINSTQSSASGLATYSPSAGLNSVDLSANFFTSINSDWSLGVFGQLQLLGTQVADSPLVKERGDSFQSILGVSLTRSF